MKYMISHYFYIIFIFILHFFYILGPWAHGPGPRGRAPRAPGYSGAPWTQGGGAAPGAGPMGPWAQNMKKI